MSADVDEEYLSSLLDDFPTYEGDEAVFNRADGMVDGCLSDVYDWYPEFKETAEAYLDGDADRNDVIDAVAQMPTFKYRGDEDAYHRHLTAAGMVDELNEITEWIQEVYTALDTSLLDILPRMEEQRDDFDYLFDGRSAAEVIEAWRGEIDE